MKRTGIIAAVVAFTIIATGCGDASAANSRTNGSGNSVDDVLAKQAAASSASSDEQSLEELDAMEEADLAEADSAASSSSSAVSGGVTPVGGSGKALDAPDAMKIEVEGDYVDLTTISSTMVYTEVYNMMFYPENFVGKTVKMKGAYTSYLDEATNKLYHACMVKDATACCSQGIEFELTSDYKYPDDYPKEADEVTVEGVFDLYTENGYKYCTLRKAKLCES